MSFNWFKFSILIVTVVVMSSCLWDNDDTELSTNPYFYSLKFAENDSIPNLETAVFSLQYDSLLMDSVIVNLDSLPHLTRIDSVFPTFTFRSTYAAYIILRDSTGTGTDTLMLTGKDTIDFNRVVGVRNIAENKKAERTYPIKVNVHQVQPELFHWNRLTTGVYTHPGSVQRTVLFNDKFYFFASSGVNNYLYTSADGINWSAENLQGFPSDVVDLRSLTIFNNSMFYLHETGELYSSPDGISWVKVPADSGSATLVNLLFVLEGKLWATVRNTVSGDYHFATSTEGVVWTAGQVIPDNFPVGDYASLSFKSRTGKPKAIVIGGYSKDGLLLRKVWSVEKNVYNQYNWVDFSIENTTLQSLAGASLVHYDNKLLLFGGADMLKGAYYRESIDEGLSWRNADTTYNVIYDGNAQQYYAPRNFQSVIHAESTKSLYLFGGKTTKVYSDVWRGRLNRLSFIRQ